MPRRLKIISSVQEKVLVTQIRAGSEKAYVKVYNQYFEPIYQFIYFKVSSREVAEDLSAEVFFKIWRYLNQGKRVRNLRALLYTTARNIVTDYYRKKKEVSLDLAWQEQFVASQQEVAEQVNVLGDIERVKRGLGQMKEEYQELLILRYDQGLSHKEIGEIIGKKTGAVRVLMHRALKELKQRVST